MSETKTGFWNVVTSRGGKTEVEPYGELPEGIKSASSYEELARLFKEPDTRGAFYEAPENSEHQNGLKKIIQNMSSDYVSQNLYSGFDAWIKSYKKGVRAISDNKEIRNALSFIESDLRELTSKFEGYNLRVVQAVEYSPMAFWHDDDALRNDEIALIRTYVGNSTHYAKEGGYVEPERGSVAAHWGNRGVMHRSPSSEGGRLVVRMILTPTKTKR